MSKCDARAPRLMGIVCVIILLVLACQFALAKPLENMATAAENVRTAGSSVLRGQPGLDPSQIANEKAQALYYMVAAIMAGLAFVFSFISFLINFTATRQHRKDVQFYEALKRFGDESAALRCGSVGLLCMMANKDRKNQKSYLYTALEQLATGLLIEKDSIVLMRIRQGIQRLVPMNSKEVFELIAGANFDLQHALVQAVADYCGLHGVKHGEDIPEEVWGAITSLNAHYDRPVIESLVKSGGWPVLFEDRLRITARQLSRTSDGDFSHTEEAERELRIAADRLAEGVKVLAHATKRWKVPQLELINCFLVDADLRKAPLRGVALTGSFIHGAWFDGAELGGTKLAGVHFDESSNFVGTNWWAADFYFLQGRKGVDESLLGQLANKYPNEMTKHGNEASPSVRQFRESRNTGMKDAT